MTSANASGQAEQAGEQAATVIVQRSDRLPLKDHEALEQHNRGSAWPALKERGIRMVGSGTWTFGSALEVVSSHFVLPNLAAVEELAALDTAGLVESTELRLIELDGVATAATGGQPPSPPQPGRAFGRASIVSERTYVVPTGAQADFSELSTGLIWPWLEQAGGRMIGFGHDPFAPSEELVTLFAFSSLAEWQRLSRPASALAPPDDVVAAWVGRSALIERHWGRLLSVTSDYGRDD